MTLYKNFVKNNLENNDVIWSSSLPQKLIPTSELFSQIWKLHPPDFHRIKIHGKEIPTPRWQQAYNRTYVYTGSSNTSLPVPEILKPYWKWSQENIDKRLNAILLNWYDGGQQHYIGKHRDSTVGLIHDTPIVTISLGEERIFRLRPWRGKGYRDFLAHNGSVFILPYDTNLRWTHEVPAFKKWQQKRVSITLRCFED